MRGFIDDALAIKLAFREYPLSQSAFVRGFIDDYKDRDELIDGRLPSQSAFVRGFIDDAGRGRLLDSPSSVSIRVRARLHR